MMKLLHTLQDDVLFRCPICRRGGLFIRTRAVNTLTGSTFATPDPERSTHAFLVIDMRTPFVEHGCVEQVYLSRGDGRLYVVLDTGAVGNLCGDRCAQRVATQATQRRQRPSQTKLKNSLEVGDVGNGTQKAFWEATLPLAMPTEGGACIQNMSVPMVDRSDLPCLWGLSSLTANRGIID